ncbi:MAG: hypothetical protein EAZ16_01535 [Sphingobacteriales bacterium]|nr:MAG: hypothetical protein EAZ16_01535 [Sphingobacteriales bacterium]
MQKKSPEKLSGERKPAGAHENEIFADPVSQGMKNGSVINTGNNILSLGRVQKFFKSSLVG